MSVTVVPGSFMRLGDQPRYWSYYRDHFQRLTVSAQMAEGRILHRNWRLGAFVSPAGALNGGRPLSFFPPALAGEIKNPMLVNAVMTGGRTFLVDKTSHRVLGLPDTLALDLNQAGWGEGLLEIHPEIKGAGTLFERTRLSLGTLRSILHRYPKLKQVFDVHCGDGVAPVIFASLAAYMRRNLGGQSDRFARHSTEASEALLGRSKIKFVPSWLATAQSDAYHDTLRRVSEALDEDAEVFEGVIANEIRFTPSTVRAVYFDKAEDDRVLTILCERVSRNSDELEQTYNEMVLDFRRHFDVLAEGTTAGENGTYFWIKIGDINEKFKKDGYGRYRDAEDYRKQRFAWFLAKDEVIVRQYGKFFCDMEAYFGKDVGIKADSFEELLLHHELMCLNILRDHIRILTKFRVAMALASGGQPSHHVRKDIQGRVWRDLLSAVERSTLVGVEIRPDSISVTLTYATLNGLQQRYVFSRADVAECYS